VVDLNLVSHSGETSKDIFQLQQILSPNPPFPPLITKIMYFEVMSSHIEICNQTPKLTEKVKPPQGRI